MARCEDCIHNVICEKLEDFRDPLCWISTKGEFICSYYKEADVVPKSEAEKWFRECEELQGRMIELESEVARDIDDLKRYIILNENIAIKCKQENGEQNEEYWKGKISAFSQIRGYIRAELKKNYIGE